MHVFLLGACRDSSCNVMEHRRQGAKQRNNVQWKTKLREDCRKLAEQRRSDVLARHRSSCSPEQLKTLIQEDVLAAVHHELQRQLLLDDDDAQEGSSSSSSVDVNALLAELEQQVLADVREHLAALEEYEAEALQDQVAYIEQLQQQQQAYQAPSPQQQQQQQASPGQWQQAQHQQHVPQLASPGLMQRSPGFFLPQASPGQQHTPSPAAPLQQQQQQPGLGLLCPVCRAAHMVARHGCLVCPAEGYVLNVAAEGLGLEDLARRLGQVQQEHASRQCPGAVCFSVEQLVPGEPAALVATCSTCQLLELVV